MTQNLNVAAVLALCLCSPKMTEATPWYEKTGDADQDGVYDIYDAFPGDPAASVDADFDGLPDAWNSGMSSSDSTLGLSIDSNVTNDSNYPGIQVARRDEIKKVIDASVRSEFQVAAMLSKINLEASGLELVKSHYDANQLDDAAAALLTFYKTKFASSERSVESGRSVSEIASEGMRHIFPGNNSEWSYRGTGYDWVTDTYSDAQWMVWHQRDFGRIDELQGAWRATGNPAFFRETMARLISYFEHAYPFDEDLENKHFRVNHPFNLGIRGDYVRKTIQFWIHHPDFTAEDLAFLMNAMYESFDMLTGKYTEKGNHLTSELLKVMQASFDFSELKIAPTWREDAIQRTSQLLFKEVYRDGMNLELSPHYHGDYCFRFRDFYELAKSNGYGSSYSQEYIDLLFETFEVAKGFMLPDMRRVAFGDAWPREMRANFYFDEYQDSDATHKYLATEGASGVEDRNNKYEWGGFYALRSDWGFEDDDPGIGLILKSGDEASWHNQPDNLTFALRAFDRTLIHDAGQQTYGGDDAADTMREKYKRSRVHNLVTLDNADTGFENRHLRRWLEEVDAGSFDYDLFEVQSQAYSNLLHTRTVVFLDKKYYVIVDKLSGTADSGTLRAHFQFGNEYEWGDGFSASHHALDASSLTAYTKFPEKEGRKGNLLVKGWSQSGLSLVSERLGIGKDAGGAGFFTINAGVDEIERNAIAFELDRDSGDQYFVTALVPFKGDNSAGAITPTVEVDFDPNEDSLTLEVNGVNYEVELPSGLEGAVDSDGDGAANINDPWPLDEASSSDTDGDGIPDNLDYDIDGDGWMNELEEQLGLNPLDPNDTQSSQLVDMVTGLPNVAPTLKDVPGTLEGSSSNITGDIKVSIDGDTNEDNHTWVDDSTNVWWQLDLQQLAFITDVDITPVARWKDELTGGFLGVSDFDMADKTPDEAEESGALVIPMTAYSDSQFKHELRTLGRYVRIWGTPNQRWVTLTEVAIQASFDLDNDGVSNSDEITSNTSMISADTDGDGSDDSADQFPTDSNKVDGDDYDDDGVDDLVDTDDDNDGMSDTWEQSHGLNRIQAADASIDSDQDGFSNLDEYIAGTNPNNSSSRLEVTSQRDGEISWKAVSGRQYVIEYSTSGLADSDWLTHKVIQASSNDGLADLPETNAPNTFYRVRVLPE